MKKYLLKVSDVDAASRTHYVNLSEENLSTVFMWPRKITIKLLIHWYRHNGWREAEKSKFYPANASFLFKLQEARFFLMLVFLFEGFFWFFLRFLTRKKLYGFKKAVLYTLKVKKEEDRARFIIKDAKSLRKIVKYPDLNTMPLSEANMLPLRLGR